MKKYPPIAKFMKKMIELNEMDEFDLEKRIEDKKRRQNRKNQLLFKLKDTIIKYGGKRKEKDKIEGIFSQMNS